MFISMGIKGNAIWFTSFSTSMRIMMVFELKSHVFNVYSFDILFEEWSSKDVIYYIGNGKWNNEGTSFIVNRCMTSETNVM